MSSLSSPPGFQPVRRDRLLQEAVHDSYKTKGKPHEPTICRDCGAVYQKGRWQWLKKPADADQTTCPACHRIHDNFPAGFVLLSGEFLADHEQEILHLVRNLESREKIEHPLQRIMNIDKKPTGLEVTTTDIHLARGIGDAVHHAYQGNLEFHYNPEQNLVRVYWNR